VSEWCGVDHTLLPFTAPSGACELLGFFMCCPNLISSKDYFYLIAAKYKKKKSFNSAAGDAGFFFLIWHAWQNFRPQTPGESPVWGKYFTYVSTDCAYFGI